MLFYLEIYLRQKLYQQYTSMQRSLSQNEVWIAQSFLTLKSHLMHAKWHCHISPMISLQCMIIMHLYIHQFKHWCIENNEVHTGHSDIFASTVADPEAKINITKDELCFDFTVVLLRWVIQLFYKILVLLYVYTLWDSQITVRSANPLLRMYWIKDTHK